jgi:hypothetical protein
MKRHTAARMAWGIWGLSLVLAAMTWLLLWLNRSQTPFSGRLSEVALPVLFATPGAVIVARRPANPIGWIFCAIGLTQGITGFANEYGHHALVTRPGSLPGGVRRAGQRRVRHHGLCLDRHPHAVQPGQRGRGGWLLHRRLASGRRQAGGQHRHRQPLRDPVAQRRGRLGGPQPGAWQLCRHHGPLRYPRTPGAGWTAVDARQCDPRQQPPLRGEQEGPALSGVGIAIVGAHDNRVIRNRITGNVPSDETEFSGGVAVVTDFVGTAPANNLIQGNIVLRNDPDLFWDGTGSGNRFRHNRCETSDPAGLCGH